MRAFLLLVLATVFAFATAIPITPSAPRLQKRAEQFRLQGLKEVYDIPTWLYFLNNFIDPIP